MMVRSSISSSSSSSPTKPTAPIQTGGRWQGGKGKYPRHYEVGVADLIEMGEINGWRIRRCDIARVLLVEPCPDGEAVAPSHHEQHLSSKEQHRQAFVLLFAPRQYRMVVPLLQHVGKPMPFAALFAEGTYDSGRDRLLREKVAKPVRKKLALLGLTLRNAISYGYLVQVEPETPERSLHDHDTAHVRES